MSAALSNEAPLGKRRGRHRTFEDVEVFQQVALILLEGGMSSFSLPRLAQRVGCSHQSLSERFSSRAGLLHAYQQWTISIFRENVAELQQQFPSPIEQIRQLLLMPLDERIGGAGRFHSPGLWVVLFLEAQRDPALAEDLAESQTAIQALLRDMVKEAQRQGELRAGDPVLIAEALLTSTTGAAVIWLLHPVEDVFEKMERCFDGTLQRFTP